MSVPSTIGYWMVVVLMRLPGILAVLDGANEVLFG